MRNGAGEKKFIIGDYLFYAYMNWAGPNFLPLTVYYKLYAHLKWNPIWNIMLEFKGNEVIAWNKFECEPAYEFVCNEDSDDIYIIGEDQQNDIWTGIEKLSPDDDFFREAYPLIEPELQNIRADIILGE